MKRSFTINVHEGKSKIFLVSANQAKKLINFTKKYVLLFLRENQFVEDSVRENPHLDECNKKHKQQQGQFLRVYMDVFQVPKGIPSKREVDHKIHLFLNTPLPKFGLFRQFFIEASEVKKKLQQLLEQGFIQPSISPCGSPIIIVLNKDGTSQMCIDYKQLNKITLKNKYPFPRIDDILHRMQKSKYFTNLGLKFGYHQVQVREKYSQKNAFITKQGLYKQLVMPFGFCNAPNRFMMLINEILCHFINSFVIVYLVHIPVYNST